MMRLQTLPQWWAIRGGFSYLDFTFGEDQAIIPSSGVLIRSTMDITCLQTQESWCVEVERCL